MLQGGYSIDHIDYVMVAMVARDIQSYKAIESSATAIILATIVCDLIEGWVGMSTEPATLPVL